MILQRLVVGALEVNCFVIADEKTGEAAVIDPGDNVSDILAFTVSRKLTVKYIINTHCHFDHAGGNMLLKEKTGARLLVHEQEMTVLERMHLGASAWGFKVDESPQPDMLLKDGDVITLGGISIQVIHTPGHTPGGICLLAGGKMISGDTLFAGGIGRTDFPGGNHEALIRSVKERLFVLPESTEVYPGHGPSTTIGEEKHYNPFF